MSSMELPTYNVRFYKDGKWWMVEIPEIDGPTQARHLREADGIARDYIAATLDVPEDSFTLAVSDSPAAVCHEVGNAGAGRRVSGR